MIGQPQDSFEVGILGASLAGASAALILARAGIRVALFDRNEFPRRKPCGEGLSLSGVKSLERLGIPGSSLRGQSLRGYRVWSGAHSSFTPLLDDAGGEKGGVGISRKELDQQLFLQCQKEANIALFLGRSVNIAPAEKSGFEFSREDETSRTSPILLFAGGAVSRRPPGVATLRSSLDRYAFSREYRVESGVLPPLVQIFLEKEYEVYLTPLPGAQVNLAIISSKEKFPELFQNEGQEVIRRELERRLSIALSPRDAALPTGPLGNAEYESSRDDLWLLGDACEQFDPIGGMGMTHALLSGILAADCLLPAMRGEISLHEAAESYRERRREAARPLRGFTRITMFGLRSLPVSRFSVFLRESLLARGVSGAIHGLDQGLLTKFSSGLIHLAGTTRS